ncbi:hypothetical protein AMATHDRAFT_982 [Amanita thiersii Skay4041]|uniref:Uncharacterized protein n=1 Tax=Amanita thiersii Skay4041 TaxID=703135 RepID=A0A2A9NYW1_9AGAR|nr:hypothetical protein AMATHDRAFT_982 [Amanita thiersii Skay4041]
MSGHLPKSGEPDRFLRLQPSKWRSSSGEPFSLDHVVDSSPFLPQQKRPWVSRRKSRKPDPPWKKFVTTFRVAPLRPAKGGARLTDGQEQAQIYQDDVYHLDGTTLLTLDSSSSMSSGASTPSSFSQSPIDTVNLMNLSYPAPQDLVQDVKQESDMNNHFFEFVQSLLPHQQDLSRDGLSEFPVSDCNSS